MLGILWSACCSVAAPLDDLKIDPLLFAEAAQTWQIIGSEDNPVWPGWNASATPLLFYLPGIQEVLINHPKPPDGFRPCLDAPEIAGFEAFVRDRETTFINDGQNTSTRVGGVSTLVVADTLSNKKLTLDSLVAAARDGRGEPVHYEQLSTSPYDQMTMIAHEAFHVYQDQHAAQKRGNELALIKYPVLSVDNNVGFVLEAEALFRALTTEDDAELEEAATQWLAARNARRKLLSAESIAYEDGAEFNEGLAKYVEYALLTELEGAEPIEGLRWAQGFHGFDDLAPERTKLVQAMHGFLRGDTLVNNDPYGTAPARMRFYYSGMAIACILDRLGESSWTERIFEPKTTLTGLVAECLPGDEAKLQEAREELRASVDLADVVAKKTKLKEDGARANEQVAREVLEGDGTLLIFDYSKRGGSSLGLTFTPFGIRALDDQRTLFTQIAMSGSFGGGCEFQQKRAAPILQFHAEQRAAFRIRERLDPTRLMEYLQRKEFDGAVLDDLRLDLEEARIQLRRVRVECRPGEVIFRLE